MTVGDRAPRYHLRGEAVYHGIQGALAGEDFTGLLAIPAGLALIALGARTLWEGRRLDQPRAVRYGKRALLAVAALVVASMTAFPTLG